MNDSIFQTILYVGIVAVVAVTMKRLNSTRKKKMDVVEGMNILQLPKIFAVIAWVCVSIGFICVITAIFANLLGKMAIIESFLFAGIMSIICFGIGIPLLLFHSFFKVKFNNEIIIQSSMTNKKTSMSWDNIKGVSFKKMSQYLIFDNNEKIIKIHTQMIGFDRFIEFMRNKIDSSLYKEALEQYSETNTNIIKAGQMNSESTDYKKL